MTYPASEAVTVQHWESRVECFVATTPQALTRMLNAYSKGRFVVGTKVYLDGGEWIGFLWFKVKA
jgi:ubiquinone biosynthesis protein UbiJ